jgi:hypothetical protein
MTGQDNSIYVELNRIQFVSGFQSDTLLAAEEQKFYSRSDLIELRAVRSAMNHKAHLEHVAPDGAKKVREAPTCKHLPPPERNSLLRREDLAAGGLFRFFLEVTNPKGQVRS